MSIKKIIAGIAAAAVSAAFMSISAFAEEISVNKDFKTTWTDSTTIPGTEFSEVNENTVLTIKYTTDASLADTEGQNYWVIKPMINDNGWPFIAGISQLRLSESGDSYELDTDKTEASFTIPADSIEHLQTAGMALMGHGVVLETITISNDISINDDNLIIQTAESKSSDDTPDEDTAADDETASEKETASDDSSGKETVSEEDNTASETAAPAEEAQTATEPAVGITVSPKTGNSSIAASICIMALAASAMAVTRKK